MDDRNTAMPDTDARRLEAALTEALDPLLDEVGHGLAGYWPDYAQYLEVERAGIIDAAMLFVHRLVEMSDGALAGQGDLPTLGDETVHLVFEHIGRQHQHDGVDLNRLLTAFQFGARVAWRHVANIALGLGMQPTALALLADSVFVFVNQLSFSATRGYLQAQIDDSRERERLREELSELLLSGRASEPAIRSAAIRCGWRIPERAAPVLVDVEDAAARRVLDRLGGEMLPIRRDNLYGVIVPDPDTPGRPHLAQQLLGVHAVVGSAVPLQHLPRSTDIAHAASQLRSAGLLTGDPVFVEENLDTIIVWRDRGLVEALGRQVLAPLDDVGDDTRDRLVETLRAWLLRQGDHRATAEDLNVHPQTVRYRLRQLRDLLGDAMDDPRSRARLFLALAWRRD
jgi:hypothetical protein